MDAIDDILEEMNFTEKVETKDFPMNEKEAEKQKKAEEKRLKDEEKAQAKAQKEAEEIAKKQADDMKRQELEDTVQKKKAEAQAEHAESSLYPNLQNTDIKFVLDKFFEKFKENWEALRENPETKVISVYDVYRYFERYFDIRSKIDTKWEELEGLAGKLETFKDYKVYDAYEFALFYYTIWFWEEAKRYLRAKRNLDKEEKRLFNELRPKYPSDVATKNAVEWILDGQMDDLATMRENQESREIKLKGYVRLAEHIKSDNIKELAEAKRMDSLQNTNPHYK